MDTDRQQILSRIYSRDSVFTFEQLSWSRSEGLLYLRVANLYSFGFKEYLIDDSLTHNELYSVIIGVLEQRYPQLVLKAVDKLVEEFITINNNILNAKFIDYDILSIINILGRKYLFLVRKYFFWCVMHKKRTKTQI